MNRRITLAGACGAFSACALIVVSAGLAGPLDPPAGPITPTYKTLTEIEPRIAMNEVNTPGDDDSVFKIVTHGSYYLTTCADGQPGKVAIEIASDDVTVDLNGFELCGVQGSLQGARVTFAGARNVCIKNGTVRAWGGHGIDTTLASGAMLLELRVTGNAGRGIEAGPNTVLHRCIAIENVSAGISTGNNCTLTECTAAGGQANGFVLGNGCTVTACTAASNLGIGMVTGSGCTISRCTARANGTSGFDFFDGCTVESCTSSANLGHGLYAGDAKGLTIQGCTFETNALDGMHIGSDSRVLGNSCDSNGFSTSDGAGIYVQGRHNRIEENNVVDNDRGVHVVGDHNLIVRNSCADNGTNLNFVIAAGNFTGTIVTTEAAMNSANNGNVNISY
jgi:hypothetical protein